MRILVIEDNPVVAAIVCDLLREQGHEPEVRADSEEARAASVDFEAVVFARFYVRSIAELLTQK